MMNRSIVLRPLPTASFLRVAILGGFSVLGLCSALLIADAGQAQSASDLNLYGDIARKIERNRRDQYNQVKQIMGGNVPANVCQQGGIPGEVRKICDRFEDQSRDLITGSGMSVSTFNELTRYCQQNPKPKNCPR